MYQGPEMTKAEKEDKSFVRTGREHHNKKSGVLAISKKLCLVNKPRPMKIPERRAFFQEGFSLVSSMSIKERQENMVINASGIK